MEFSIIITSLILSAFFSGAEIAYISASKLRIELLKKRNNFSARILSKLFESPPRFIGAALIGNNIALVIFGLSMAEVLQPALVSSFPSLKHQTFYVMVIQTLITTCILLFAGEFLPKALVRINPDAVLRFLAIPLAAAYYLLFPIVTLITSLTRRMLTKFFKLDYGVQKPVFSKTDLEIFIRQTSPEKAEEAELNKDIFERALGLPSSKIRECMVPRREVIAIDRSETSMTGLKEKFIITGLSKILVYRESIDNIIGYVHRHAMFIKPESMDTIIIPITVVTETQPARQVLDLFITERKSIAWVVDEYGGTAGIVTMEDILEEIFGEIEDEHDVEESLIERQVAENDFLFSGRLEIDYLNHKYGLGLPRGDYETIAGLIISEHRTIPERNEELVVGKYRLKVLSISENRRIETVRVRPAEG